MAIKSASAKMYQFLYVLNVIIKYDDKVKQKTKNIVRVILTNLLIEEKYVLNYGDFRKHEKLWKETCNSQNGPSSRQALR